MAGREVRISSPDKIYFPELEATKFDLVSYYLEVAERPAQHGRRASGHAPAVPQRGRRQVVLPEAGARQAPRCGWRRPRSPPPTGPPPTPWWWPTSPTWRGPSIWAASACTCGRIAPQIPTFADELRIDLDPQPGVGFDEVRTAAFHCRELLTELGMVAYPKTTGNRGLHIYVRLEPRWDATAVRSGAVAVGPGAGATASRAHHGQLVEGGTREAGLRRLQPERPAQDRLRGVVRPAPDRRPGFDSPLVGRGRRRGTRRPDHPDRAGAAGAAGRSLGGDRRRSPSRSSRSSTWSSGTRRPGSTTRRGRPSTPRPPDEPTAGGAQPSEEDVSEGMSHGPGGGPPADRLSLGAKRGRHLQGPRLPQRRHCGRNRCPKPS